MKDNRTIGETVRDAQEILVKLNPNVFTTQLKIDAWVGENNIVWQDQRPIQYPQSLGGLCLEVARYHFSRSVKAVPHNEERGKFPRDIVAIMTHMVGGRLRWFIISAEDCHALRRAMWHKG